MVISQLQTCGYDSRANVEFLVPPSATDTLNLKCAKFVKVCCTYSVLISQYAMLIKNITIELQIIVRFLPTSLHCKRLAKHRSPQLKKQSNNVTMQVFREAINMQLR